MDTPDLIQSLLADAPALLRRRAAAELLSVSPRTIDRMLRRGEIEALTIGGLVRIPRASIESLLRRATA